MPTFSGKLALIRHGETYANVDHVWHGQTDTELTELGYQQAKQLGSYFHNYMLPDVIYTSPLQRARNTALAIAESFNLTVTLDPRLMEFDLGDLEGTSFKKLSEESDIIEKLVNDPEFRTPNGESQLSVKTRMAEAIDEITSKHHNQNIIIVAHGVAISIALAHYIDQDSTCWPKYRKGNTSFSELCFNTKKLLRFNMTDHLTL